MSAETTAADVSSPLPSPEAHRLRLQAVDVPRAIHDGVTEVFEAMKTAFPVEPKFSDAIRYVVTRGVPAALAELKGPPPAPPKTIKALEALEAWWKTVRHEIDDAATPALAQVLGVDRLYEAANDLFGEGDAPKAVSRRETSSPDKASRRNAKPSPSKKSDPKRAKNPNQRDKDAQRQNGGESMSKHGTAKERARARNRKRAAAKKTAKEAAK